jgi:hypothetical protein
MPWPQAAGRTVLISSLAAFEGARSRYGQTKLERAVLELGGVVLRSGLVFGVDAGGLFGAMVAAIRRHPFAPLIGGGSRRLFVTHDGHLCELAALEHLPVAFPPLTPELWMPARQEC